MKKMDLIFDVDNTIIDTVKVLCDYYSEIYSQHPDYVTPIPENVTRWNVESECPLMTLGDILNAFESRFLFDNVDIFDNCVEVINKLNEDERFNVYFCSIGSAVNISNKTRFLKKHFPNVQQIMLVKPGDAVMCKKMVNMNINHTIFVDDHKNNLEGCNAKYPIMYSQDGLTNKEWNEGYTGTIVDNWKILDDLINYIYNIENGNCIDTKRFVEFMKRENLTI